MEESISVAFFFIFLELETATFFRSRGLLKALDRKDDDAWKWTGTFSQPPTGSEGWSWMSGCVRAKMSDPLRELLCEEREGVTDRG